MDGDACWSIMKYLSSFREIKQLCYNMNIDICGNIKVIKWKSHIDFQSGIQRINNSVSIFSVFSISNTCSIAILQPKQTRFTVSFYWDHCGWLSYKSLYWWYIVAFMNVWYPILWLGVNSDRNIKENNIGLYRGSGWRAMLGVEADEGYVL
jgi:hypothetical protein